MNEALYISNTKRWIKQFVIGLNLCPFAADPYLADQIRYTVNLENDSMPIVNCILEEAQNLLTNRQIETSFVILPFVDLLFGPFFDFINDIEELIRANNLEMKLIAFHPDFFYRNSAPQDTTNATNQSPYPMVHIIKKSSLEKARKSTVDVEKIPVRNKILLMGMTQEQIEAIYQN